eukprot:6212522-Pleurochrysis_carterae.AAC.2
MAKRGSVDRLPPMMRWFRVSLLRGRLSPDVVGGLFNVGVGLWHRRLSVSLVRGRLSIRLGASL